jgi:hypothetical protein
MGPNLLWHLGGGEGGIRHFMDTLMPQMANALWPTLGNPELTLELQEKIVKGVLEEADGHSIDELAADRDAMLCALLDVRTGHAASGSQGAAASQPA